MKQIFRSKFFCYYFFTFEKTEIFGLAKKIKILELLKKETFFEITPAQRKTPWNQFSQRMRTCTTNIVNEIVGLVSLAFSFAQWQTMNGRQDCFSRGAKDNNQPPRPVVVFLGDQELSCSGAKLPRGCIVSKLFEVSVFTRWVNYT